MKKACMLLLAALMLCLPFFANAQSDAQQPCGCVVLKDKAYNVGASLYIESVQLWGMRSMPGLDGTQLFIFPTAPTFEKGQYAIKTVATPSETKREGNYAAGDLQFFPVPCFAVKVCLGDQCETVVPEYSEEQIAYSTTRRIGGYYVEIAQRAGTHPLKMGTNRVHILQDGRSLVDGSMQFVDGQATLAASRLKLSFEIIPLVKPADLAFAIEDWNPHLSEWIRELMTRYGEIAGATDVKRAELRKYFTEQQERIPNFQQLLENWESMAKAMQVTAKALLTGLQTDEVKESEQDRGALADAIRRARLKAALELQTAESRLDQLTIHRAVLGMGGQVVAEALKALQ